MRDTSPEADRRYHDLLRAQPPYARLARAVSLSNTVRKLALAGLRQRFPNATEAELNMRLVVRLYGREAAARLFASLPDDAV